MADGQRPTTHSQDPSPAGAARREAASAELGGQLRVVLGALSLVGGLTWLLLNASGSLRGVDVATGVILVASGLVLVLHRHIPWPTRPALPVAGVATVFGATTTLGVHSAALGGMFAYVERRGFPFTWLSRGGVADDPETARQAAAMDAWDVSVLPLLVNMFVWASAGVVIVVLAHWLRRDRKPATRRGTG
jgi:hypothetical protein